MVTKSHKPTNDFIYIAAGIKSSTQQLFKLLSGVLTLVDNKLIRIYNYEFKFTGTSGYWIVTNKDAVTSKLNYLNNIHYMLNLLFPLILRSYILIYRIIKK